MVSGELTRPDRRVRRSVWPAPERGGFYPVRAVPRHSSRPNPNLNLFKTAEYIDVPAGRRRAYLVRLWSPSTTCARHQTVRSIFLPLLKQRVYVLSTTSKRHFINSPP